MTENLNVNEKNSHIAFFPQIPQAINLPGLFEDAKNGKISSEDARKIYDMAQKNEVLSKYHFPTKPSGDNYYHIYVSDDTKSSGRRAIKDKTLEGLREKVYQYERGLQGTARKTFAEVFEIALAEKMRLVKDPEKRLSTENTIGKYRSDFRRYITGTPLEKLYVDEIRKKDIEAVCLLNLERYDLTEKSFRALRGVLKMVFDLAFGEYWISDNPYNRMNFKKFVSMTVRSAPVTDRVHSDEELARFLESIREWHIRKPDYLPAYALEMQMIMGLRRGEIPPLRWSDIKGDYVSIEREQITVKRNGGKQKEYFQIVNHTKTHRSRKYPVTNELNAFLTRLRRVHALYYPGSDYLFPADSANGVITNNTVYNFYRRICRKNGIELKREIIRGTHSFRRNCITSVVNATNGNIILASKLFGNTPAVADKNYYTGIDLEKARMVLNG